jgi:hypothetical protein
MTQSHSAPTSSSDPLHARLEELHARISNLLVRL